MRYTSWDRSNTDKPKLLAEEGPLELAEFSQDTAKVGEQTWNLTVDKSLGASATVDGDEDAVYRLAGNIAKDEQLNASLNGRSFVLINESGKDWIVEDANGDKVAQFSGANKGVRRAILEFEGKHGEYLVPNEIVALSWFARLLLEDRLVRSNNVLIITLIILALVVVLVWLI